MLKSILKLHLIVFISSIAIAGINESESYNLVSNEAIKVSFADADMLNLFDSAKYDNKNSRLEFKSSKDIQYIQIFNKENVLEFQLMVDAKKVLIDKDLFSKGHNRLGFLLKDSHQLHFTEVLIY